MFVGVEVLERWIQGLEDEPVAGMTPLFAVANAVVFCGSMAVFPEEATYRTESRHASGAQEYSVRAMMATRAISVAVVVLVGLATASGVQVGCIFLNGCLWFEAVALFLSWSRLS